jgi:two-component system phosphate regulon response regulator OmpR
VNQHRSHILAVDDDDRLRDLLKRYLSREGHDVTTAKDAASARKLMATMTFDLVILDVMMPGEDGLSLLKSVREKKSDTPIILLTARGQPSERIEGLKLGADDYLAKPFEPEELALRITSILKRAPSEAPVEELKLAGMSFHVGKGELRKDGRLVRLTESETQLLSILAARAGAAISRHELAMLTAAGVERSVDVQVTRLRRKIERDPREPVHLQTVRGVGYRLTGE